MFLRKIGKFLRGKATPFQIMSATVLGGLLGSMPGLTQGPLLMMLLLFLLIVLNANLFLGTLMLVAAKILYLVLLPLYFKLGVAVLEGPLGNLVAIPVNAPVTAWFGFDYYVMLPALVTGGLTGLLAGIGLSRALASFRRKMASLESGSERYQAYTSKFWVRALAWLFVGGVKGKKNWSELAELKRGLPVRPLGIVFVVALGVLVIIGFKLMDETIITSNVRDALERANGATVDIDSVNLLPGEGKILINGLAMADPENLQTNRFASSQIVADVSGMDLLAKKVVIDSLQILEPSTGTERRFAGRLTVDQPEPEKPVAEGEEASIYDYVENAQLWRERLSTLKRLYDRIAPHMKKDGEDDAATEEKAGEPGWRERLAQRAAEEGYAHIKSDSLIRESPRLWIRELAADNLEIGGNDDRFRIRGTNLATQPALIEASGTLTVSRQDDKLEVVLGLPSASAPNRSALKVRYLDLPVSYLKEKVGDDLPLEGGSLDISGEGVIDEAILDLPLKVTLNDTTLSAFGSTMKLNDFPLDAALTGPLDNPRIRIPKDALENAVKRGAQDKVKGLIEENVGDKLKGLFGGGNDG